MLSFIDIHKAHCADLVYRSGSEQTTRVVFERMHIIFLNIIL